MQSLQDKAAAWSGVASSDAFSIDETNLFQTLGLQAFVDLSTNFYTRCSALLSSSFCVMFDGPGLWLVEILACVSCCNCFDVFVLFGCWSERRVYEDEEEWFRSIFAGSRKEDAIQNQYEFFVQRMGGPPLYSQRRGHPALIGRHRPFPVTHQAADRWLHHMQLALDSTSKIDPDSKVKMMNFFRHTAFFLVAGNELKNQNPVPCKHAN